MSYLESQFTNPHGPIGHLVGFVMAVENRGRNRWALSLLNIRPTDGLLEIGFGPGWALQQASRIAVAGYVAGVDRSETMVSQARFRNHRGIQAGRVELRHGTANSIPYADESFDKVFAVNSFHEWDNPSLGLQEVRRVLKPGGLVAIIEHPHGKIDEQGIEAMRVKFAAQLEQAGFHAVRFEQGIVQGRPAFAVLGTKGT